MFPFAHMFSFSTPFCDVGYIMTGGGENVLNAYSFVAACVSNLTYQSYGYVILIQKKKKKTLPKCMLQEYVKRHSHVGMFIRQSLCGVYYVKVRSMQPQRKRDETCYSKFIHILHNIYTTYERRVVLLVVRFRKDAHIH